jgi:ribosomal protein L37AE/L43A
MFKQFIAQLTAKLQRFMAGRYGTDRLNMTILGVGLAACLISAFFRNPLVNLILTALSYGLMIWAITRTLSRNVYKRYQENRKFLQFFDRLRDRQHRYYDCPKCRQVVRVPRGKGKISITCPKCREKFIRKT